MTFPAWLEGRFTIPSGVAIDVTNNGGGPTAVTITAGSYYPYEFAATLQSILTSGRAPSSGAWSVSMSPTTGLYTIAMTAGTFSITWTSTTFRDLLGYDATITTQTSVTGATCARGFWIPDCPVMVDGDLDYAGRVTDLRQTEGPTGLVFGLVGNTKYRYRRLRFSHVPRDRAWGATASTTPTWQLFLMDVQFALGHSYFTASSPIKVRYGSNVSTNMLGNATGDFGWYMKGVNDIDPPRTSETWTGYWSIEIPELVSDGT